MEVAAELHDMVRDDLVKVRVFTAVLCLSSGLTGPTGHNCRNYRSHRLWLARAASSSSICI